MDEISHFLMEELLEEIMMETKILFYEGKLCGEKMRSCICEKTKPRRDISDEKGC